jgi:hypothetical protein
MIIFMMAIIARITMWIFYGLIITIFCVDAGLIIATTCCVDLFSALGFCPRGSSLVMRDDVSGIPRLTCPGVESPF